MPLELLEKAFLGVAQLRDSSQITIADAFVVRAELFLAWALTEQAIRFMDSPDFPGTPRAVALLKRNVRLAYAANGRAVETLEGQESSELFLE